MGDKMEVEKNKFYNPIFEGDLKLEIEPNLSDLTANRVCNKCGKTIEWFWNYCPYCGDGKDFSNQLYLTLKENKNEQNYRGL